MNDENLRTLTPKEAREIGRKGGLASAEARRQKKDLRLALEALLEKDFTDKETGKTMSGTEILTAKLFQKASKGDTRAFEILRDTIGQKPIEKVMIAEVEQSVIDEVEKAVLGDG